MPRIAIDQRSEEHTSELQSPYVISYAVFCLKKKNKEQVRCKVRDTDYSAKLGTSPREDRASVCHLSRIAARSSSARLSCAQLSVILMLRPPPRSSLFPYRTVFR